MCVCVFVLVCVLVCVCVCVCVCSLSLEIDEGEPREGSRRMGVVVVGVVGVVGVVVVVVEQAVRQVVVRRRHVRRRSAAAAAADADADADAGRRRRRHLQVLRRVERRQFQVRVQVGAQSVLEPVNHGTSVNHGSPWAALGVVDADLVVVVGLDGGRHGQRMAGRQEELAGGRRHLRRRRGGGGGGRGRRRRQRRRRRRRRVQRVARRRRRHRVAVQRLGARVQRRRVGAVAVLGRTAAGNSALAQSEKRWFHFLSTCQQCQHPSGFCADAPLMMTLPT